MNGKQIVTVGKYAFSYKQKQNLQFGNYDFVYQFKTCTVDFFSKEFVQEYDRDVKKFLDENGCEVLSIYESIPTFDSGDREWNSYQRIYIIREKNSYAGIYLTGGYRLADVKLYSGIDAGDEKTKNLLEQALPVKEEKEEENKRCAMKEKCGKIIPSIFSKRLFDRFRKR